MGQQENEEEGQAINALTTVESTRLAELERVIDAGLRTFWQVGDALAEIRGSRLYRVEYPSFEAYCEEVWGFSRVHAHRLIEAAGVVAALPVGSTLPANEAQARELAPLPPEGIREVWEAASADGNPTAERVARAREEYLSAQALAALPPEEQLRVVQEQEQRALEGEQGGSRQEQVRAILRRTDRLVKLASGVAGAERAVTHLHQFRSAVESLA